MRFLFAVALLLAACTPPAEQAPPSADATGGVDPAIAAVVSAAMPGVAITGGESDGEGEFEVTATHEGQEYEFDLLGPDGGWRVVEIQHDIPWHEAPQPVRDLIATSPNAFLPTRVIESRQPGAGDGSVVYVLYAPDENDAPALEVRYVRGEAAIMPPAH